ncbi:MAG TPA: MFS transporter [Rhizobiaceae bacterium]|nr:MFS transporter [Rhizobiaceae bacterium]
MADSDRQIRSGRRYLAAGAVLFLALFLNNAPTPLYPIWQSEYHLGTAATTAIHSAYPVGTIVGLLFGGKLADQLGRRGVLFAAGISGLMGAALLLAFDTFLPLLLARLVNGIATGLFSGPITAAMVELEPKGDHGRASWAAALITTVSASIGTFAATAIVSLAITVQLALTLPFILQGALYAIAIAVILGLPETLPSVYLRRLRDADFLPRSISVPPGIRREFRFAACAAFTVWALTGLWLGLGSALAVSVLGQGNLFHGGAAASVMLASAGGVQVASPKLTDRISIQIGMCVTIFALFSIAAFILSRSVQILYLSTVLAGCGQGLAWLGAARLVNRVAMPSRRAETVSALYVVVYGGVTFIFLVGVIASFVGLQKAVLLLLGFLGILAAWTLWRGASHSGGN